MTHYGLQIRLLAGALVVAGLSCGKAEPKETPLQGIVELDERVIGSSRAVALRESTFRPTCTARSAEADALDGLRAKSPTQASLEPRV